MLWIFWIFWIFSIFFSWVYRIVDKKLVHIVFFSIFFYWTFEFHLWRNFEIEINIRNLVNLKILNLVFFFFNLLFFWSFYSRFRCSIFFCEQIFNEIWYNVWDWIRDIIRRFFAIYIVSFRFWIYMIITKRFDYLRKYKQICCSRRRWHLWAFSKSLQFRTIFRNIR